MTRSPARRAVVFLAFTLSPMLLVGCPKKPPPVVDAGAAAPASTPSVTDLAPLGDDGGPEAEAEAAAPKRYAGPPVNVNQLRIKQCCNAMRATHDPMMMGIAAQCDALASQVGPTGTDPAFAQLRAMLRSVKLPAGCQGL